MSKDNQTTTKPKSRSKLDKIVNELKGEEKTEKISYSVKLNKSLVNSITKICKDNNIPQTDFIEKILRDYGL